VGKWVCEIGGQRKGPFGDEQLQAMAHDGTLVATDKVWNPSDKRWEPAGRLKGLFTRGVAAATPESAAAVAVADRDSGPFFALAAKFSIKSTRRSTWWGRAVVSPAAIYLLKGEAREGGVADGSPTGVIGALAAASAGDPDDVRSCRAEELPDRVRQELDPKYVFPQSDVIVIPRGAASRVDMKWFGAVLEIQCGGDCFRVGSGMIRAGRIKTFLHNGGWTLGFPIQPTAQPVHGRAFGRVAGEAGPGAPSAALRFVYFVLAVVLCFIIFYLKYLMSGAGNW
jgi:hypothetical protein